MRAVDPDDSRPSYQQLADELRGAIQDGSLKPGDQLKTHKALAAEYGVGIETAKRALAELRAAGLIVSRQGKGSYVRRQDAGHVSQAVDIEARLDELARDLETVKQRLAALEAEKER